MQDSSYFAVCGPDTCAWLFEWKLLGITVKWRAVLTSGSLSFFVQIMKSWRVIKTEGYFQVVLFVYIESKSDSFWVIKNNQLDPHPPACFSWFSSSSRSSILTLLTPRKNKLKSKLVHNDTELQRGIVHTVCGKLSEYDILLQNQRNRS